MIRQRIDRSVPTLNTSSLPDLIFTVLFFFMVVTHMRQVTLKRALPCTAGHRADAPHEEECRIVCVYRHAVGDYAWRYSVVQGGDYSAQ